MSCPSRRGSPVWACCDSVFAGMHHEVAEFEVVPQEDEDASPQDIQLLLFGSFLVFTMTQMTHLH
eukprot:497048-Amphidinium_carterae.1